MRESLPLNNLPIKKLKPILLFNDEKYLYLLDAEKGILLFDNFGSYLKTIHLEDIKNIQVLNSLVYYFTNGKLHHLNPQTFADDAVNLPPLSGAEKQVFINADKLWLSSDGGVKLFLKK
ncbi:MAG: hypothetical protein NTX03_08660 [Bacteroidetes bacterium]|nr:hypothetical protein [Bacteroidota bacterium]